MKYDFRFLLFVLLASSCIGCGDNTKPHRADAIRQISDLLGFNNPNSREVIKLTNLSYDNGFLNNENNYTIAASWDVTFLKSANDLERLVHQMNSEEGMGMEFGLLALGMKFGDFKAGDVFHCSNEFPFLKTEKGWVVRKPAADATCAPSASHEGTESLSTSSRNAGAPLGVSCFSYRYQQPIGIPSGKNVAVYSSPLPHNAKPMDYLHGGERVVLEAICEGKSGTYLKLSAPRLGDNAYASIDDLMPGFPVAGTKVFLTRTGLYKDIDANADDYAQLITGQAEILEGPGPAQ
jgi:hypothetical protein